MIKPILHHILWLLLLRHDGQGLPVKRTRTFWILIALSAFVAAIRLGVQSGITHGLIMSTAAVLFTPVVVAGWALISAGVDIIAMAAHYLLGYPTRGVILWDLLESGLMVIFAFRIGRRQLGR